MKVIPVANLFLALSVIALKLVYGGLHWFTSKLYAVESIDVKLKHGVVTIAHNLSLLTIVIAIISVIIGYNSLKEKAFNNILLAIIFGISCLALVFSLIPM